MAPATTNPPSQPSHSLAGAPSIPAGQHHQAHFFPECDNAAMMAAVTPVAADGTDDDALDGLYGQFFERDGAKAGNTTMAPKTAREEDFWFPADLFTDELNYDAPAPEVVSHSSRADNSTIYSDELELDLDLFEEIPQTIDVPKRKKAKIAGGGSEQFSSQAHSSPLLASWQPVGNVNVMGTAQFSLQPSTLQALAPPPMMVRPPSFATAMPRSQPLVNNTTTQISKSKQIKDLLVILCKNIPSDPGQQVHDLMTLRMLLLRPQRTLEEDHLLDTILILFESYSNAGRSSSDIATMVVRDFSFHVQHQQQVQVPFYSAYAPTPSVSVSPVLQGQAYNFGFLSTAQSSGTSVGSRSSNSF